MKSTIISSTGDANFVARGAAFLKEELMNAITKNGVTILGLSGGSTPKPIYEALGKEQLDWSKVWIFLVDDRYIRPDHPNSNQFLLRSTLLKNAAIPESQIIFPDTTLPIDQCMKLYDQHLTDLLKKGPPDLITLGMGDDGHIASLFPLLGDDAFGPSLVIHTTTDRFDVHDRISVTLPVLQKSKQVVFFLKGSSKKAVWDEMMGSQEDERKWPAKGILNKATIFLG